ncbi:MAG: hypothetical protein WD425_00250 [Nitrospirales bacterium]
MTVSTFNKLETAGQIMATKTTRTTQQEVCRKDINVLSDEETMKKDRMPDSPSVSLKEGSEIMEKHPLMNLLVEKSGLLPKTTIRLDLLRILL